MIARIRRWLRPIAAAAAILALVGAVPTAALAADDDDADVEDQQAVDLYQVGATALDVTLLRPLGVLSLIGGFGLFVASVPLVAPSERIDTAWDIFVYGSYDYTFLRPLGELY